MQDATFFCENKGVEETLLKGYPKKGWAVGGWRKDVNERI